MTHDIHISFDNLALQNTGLQVKRGDYGTHVLNFSIDGSTNADSYRIRLKNANGETSESISLTELSYTLGAFDVSCAGIVNAELSAYSGEGRVTSASFTYEVLNDISTDGQILADDRYPVLDKLIDDAKSLAGVRDEILSKNHVIEQRLYDAEVKINAIADEIYATKEDMSSAIATAIYDSWEAEI